MKALAASGTSRRPIDSKLQYSAIAAAATVALRRASREEYVVRMRAPLRDMTDTAAIAASTEAPRFNQPPMESEKKAQAHAWMRDVCHGAAWFDFASWHKPLTSSHARAASNAFSQTLRYSCASIHSNLHLGCPDLDRLAARSLLRIIQFTQRRASTVHDLPHETTAHSLLGQTLRDERRQGMACSGTTKGKLSTRAVFGKNGSYTGQCRVRVQGSCPAMGYRACHATNVCRGRKLLVRRQSRSRGREATAAGVLCLSGNCS